MRYPRHATAKGIVSYGARIGARPSGLVKCEAANRRFAGQEGTQSVVPSHRRGVRDQSVESLVRGCGHGVAVGRRNGIQRKEQAGKDLSMATHDVALAVAARQAGYASSERDVWHPCRVGTGDCDATGRNQ